jgi:SAM-dependent methyltransferase
MAMRKLSGFLILIVSAIGMACHAAPTNSFGIYLATGPIDPRLTRSGKGDWSQITLAPAPVISAEDIVVYDFPKHTMNLRPEALARISRPPVDGTPFVVVANGERIYLGAFVTGASSMSFAVPTIVVDRWSTDTNHHREMVVIERAYPQPSFGVPPDPRGDERVKQALAAMEKLTTSIPYVPTRHDAVKDLLWLAGVGTNDVLYDLGSGDGRIALAAVRDAGARKAVGIEIKPELIEESRWHATQAGLSNLVTFIQGDLFTNDFSAASVLALYLGHQANVDLRARIVRTLRPGARVVSHQFGMGEWKPDKILEVRTALLGMYGEMHNPFGSNPEVPDFARPFTRMTHSILSAWVVPAPVAGTWRGSTRLDSGEGELSITLQQRLSESGGSFEWRGAAPMRGNVQVDIWGSHVRVHCVSTNRPYGSIAWFDGQVEGDNLRGTIWVALPDGTRQFAWNANRTPVDLAGQWEWIGPMERPVQLRVERRNGEITATYIDKDQRWPVNDIYDFGGGLYFTLLLGRDGSGRRMGPEDGWLIGSAVVDEETLSGNLTFHPYPDGGAILGTSQPRPRDAAIRQQWLARRAAP